MSYELPPQLIPYLEPYISNGNDYPGDISYQLIAFPTIRIRNFGEPSTFSRSHDLSESDWRIWGSFKGRGPDYYLASDAIWYEKKFISSFEYDKAFWKFVSYPSIEEAFDHIYSWLLINEYKLPLPSRIYLWIPHNEQHSS